MVTVKYSFPESENLYCRGRNCRKLKVQLYFIFQCFFQESFFLHNQNQTAQKSMLGSYSSAASKKKNQGKVKYIAIGLFMEQASDETEQYEPFSLSTLKSHFWACKRVKLFTHFLIHSSLINFTNTELPATFVWGQMLFAAVFVLQNCFSPAFRYSRSAFWV